VVEEMKTSVEVVLSPNAPASGQVEGHGDKGSAAGRNRDDVHVFGRRSTCQTLADGRVSTG
jgi:hypothetical protein